MIKTSKDARPELQPDEDLPTAALDFDASHDEDDRTHDESLAGSGAAARRTSQRARLQGDAPGAEVMADDLDDEHSFDDDGQPTARDTERVAGSETTLPSRELSGIGSGAGLDEAELAELDPVGQKESQSLKAKIARHARDPNAFEPAEAEVQRAIQKQKGGQQS